MTSKNPKCATIVKLTTTLQDLMKDSLKHRLERIICNDLTRGKEANPIQCVDDLDDDNEPEGYVYVKANVVTSASIPMDRNISTLQVFYIRRRSIYMWVFKRSSAASYFKLF